MTPWGKIPMFVSPDPSTRNRGIGSHCRTRRRRDHLNAHIYGAAVRNPRTGGFQRNDVTGFDSPVVQPLGELVRNTLGMLGAMAEENVVGLGRVPEEVVEFARRARCLGKWLHNTPGGAFFEIPF